MTCPKADASDESREAVEFPDSLKAQKGRRGKIKHPSNYCDDFGLEPRVEDGAASLPLPCAKALKAKLPNTKESLVDYDRGKDPTYLEAQLFKLHFDSKLCAVPM